MSERRSKQIETIKDPPPPILRIRSRLLLFSVTEEGLKPTTDRVSPKSTTTLSLLTAVLRLLSLLTASPPSSLVLSVSTTDPPSLSPHGVPPSSLAPHGVSSVFSRLPQKSDRNPQIRRQETSFCIGFVSTRQNGNKLTLLVEADVNKVTQPVHRQANTT
ncbi:hypothetical protein DY000_02008960 [Brassica cretica]|uniref:Uncharacterized protein n=1 Tax=Brassica cretica TaxID=69181 RepID=A0ABQ7C6V6_BRACR|nr:hypothetical protein DY000_02008960 [Brassica cretica]